MSTHPRFYRLVCLASILSLLMNLVSPLSIAWNSQTVKAEAASGVPAGTEDSAKPDTASPSPENLSKQPAAHAEDAANQPAQHPSAMAASAVSEQVPVNGCFQNGMWGWARRTDPSSPATWDPNGPPGTGCGKFKMQGNYDLTHSTPDLLYSMPIKIGPSAHLSYYAASMPPPVDGPGNVDVIVHDLDDGTAYSIYPGFDAVTSDGLWNHFERDISVNAGPGHPPHSYVGHRVILEFRKVAVLAPGLWISDITVSDAANPNDNFPPGFINGGFRYGTALWWATEVEDTAYSPPDHLTFDAAVGYAAAGSGETIQSAPWTAQNLVTYPFVADNQTWSFWLKADSNLTPVNVLVRVLDFGYPGMSGMGQQWATIPIPPGQNITNWTRFTVNPNGAGYDYVGHTISLMVTVQGPPNTWVYAWLDDMCPDSSGCPDPLPLSLILSTANCPECFLNALAQAIGPIFNVGKPINTLTGGEDYSTVDLSFPALGGQMTFQRSYSSLATSMYTTTLGYGWTHNYDTRLIFPGNPQCVPGQVVLFKAHSANQLIFYDNCNGTFRPFGGILATLVKTTAPYSYTLTASDKSVYSFNEAGLLVRKADAQDHAWTYSYDAGRLSRVQDGATPPRYLDFTYNPDGRLWKVTDALPRTVEFDYYPNGDLKTVKDGRGKTWTYNYKDTTSHLLTEILDPLGKIVERTEYDTSGRAARQFDGNGVKTLEITYNTNNTRVIRDAVGQVITATYDYRDTLKTLQDSAGTTRKSFDPNFRPVSLADGNSHWTSLEWSPDGANLTKVVDPQNRVTSLSYDSWNNLTRTVDALGRSSTFTYALDSRLLTRSTDALGNTTIYTYTGGFLEAQTDARGNTTRFAYNPFGQRTSITDAQDNVTRFEYDLVGRLITTTDALEHVTVNEYDNADHLVQVTQNYWAGQSQNYDNQYNIVTQYGYDDAGRRVTTTDTRDRVTRNEYDAAGRLIKVTQNYDQNRPKNDGNELAT